MARKMTKAFISRVLIAVMMVSLFIPASALDAKPKKAKLSITKITIEVGQKKTITIKNKLKKATYKFKASNKKISVSTKGKITAKTAGTANVAVKQVYKKKTTKVGTVKVTVKAGKEPVVSLEPSTAPVVNPSTSPVATASPTVAPTPTLAPTEEPIKEEDYSVPSNYSSNVAGTSYYTAKKVSYYSTTTSKDRNAYVLTPPGYSSEKTYPVLYLLHGIGGDESEWLGGVPRYILGNLLANGLAKEMVVVLPNCRARANDAGNPSDIYDVAHFQSFDNFINDLRDNLMPYIQDNYSIKTGRENTAVAGFSMGGREALNIGISMVDTFGYIGAFSPAVGLLPYDRETGLFTTSTLKLPDEYKDNTMLLIMSGNSDGVVHDTPTLYHNTLEANGTNHLFYLIDGDHDFTVWKHGLYNFAKRIF